MSGEKRTITIEIDGRQGEISAKRLEDTLARLERQLDPLGAKTKTFTSNVAYLKAGLDSGNLSVDQHAKLLGGLTRQYEVATSKLSGLNQQTQATSVSTLAANENTEKSSASIGMLATRATAAAAAVAGLVLGARALAEKVATAGDEVRQMTARFNVLTGAADGSRVAFDAVYRVAKNAGVGLDTTGAAFSRLAIAAGEFGATTDQVARVTDVVLKLGRVGGASAEELASGVQQLGQALASGKLQGDELRSILEGMPLVGKAIAKEFGVGLGQLKQLGEEGKLSADRVFRALISAGADADAQFRKLPPTLESAANRAANGWKVFTAAIDDTLGVSRLLASGLDATADRAERLAARIRGDINVALQDTIDKIKQLDARAAQGKPPTTAKDMPGADPNVVPPVVSPGAPLPKPRPGYAGQLTLPLTDDAAARAERLRLIAIENEAAARAAEEMQAYDRAAVDARNRAMGAADSRVRDLEQKALTGAAKATRDYNQAVAGLKKDLDAGLITQDRYNKGVDAAKAIMAAASGGAKQTAEAIKALAEVTRDAGFAKLMADSADKGAAALAELEAQAKAADKAVETLGKRDAVFEAKYTAALLSKRTDDFRKDFKLDTAQIERENQVLEAQIRLLNERPEIADREIALLRIRNDLIAKGQKLDPADVEARAAALADQEKLTRKIEDSKRAAELWAEPFKNAIQGVQSTMTDFFESIFSGGVRSFTSLADAAKKIWFRLMAEMASVAVIRPVINFAVGGLGQLGILGPETLRAFGITGGGSTSGSSRSAGGTASGSAASGGGFNPFGMFGQGGFSGMLGRVGDFLQTPFSFLGQSPASYAGILGEGTSGIANMQYLAGLQPGVGGFLGSITPMQGLGALAGIGSSIFSFASGNPIGGVTGLLGAGLSLIPGVGQVLGPVVGILGGILGGLFKSKPDIKSQAWHDYDPATGMYSGRKVFAQGVEAAIAPSVGNDALKLISAFGGSVAPGALPPSYYIWRGFENGRMDATVTAEGSPTYARFLNEAMTNGSAKNIDEAQWIARTRLWSDSGMVDLPINSLTTDSDKLMQQLALLILKAGVRDGSFTGLSDTSQKIIRNYPNADTQGLGEALTWGKTTYDVLNRGDTITAAEKALTDLRDSFAAAIAKAKDLGLATDGLVAAQAKAVNKYAADFQQSISDRILGIEDPAALAQLQLDREFDQLRKEAAYLNEQYAQGLTTTLININDIEKAYGLERQRIVEQSVSSLVEFERRLRYGDLSTANPLESLSGALGAYQANAAQALAGNSSAISQYQGLAEAALNAQRAYSGNDYATTALIQRMLNEIALLQGKQYGTPAANSDELAATMKNVEILLQQFLDRTQSAA